MKTEILLTCAKSSSGKTLQLFHIDTRLPCGLHALAIVVHRDFRELFTLAPDRIRLRDFLYREPCSHVSQSVTGRHSWKKVNSKVSKRQISPILTLPKFTPFHALLILQVTQPNKQKQCSRAGRQKKWRSADRRAIPSHLVYFHSLTHSKKSLSSFSSEPSTAHNDKRNMNHLARE